MIKILIGTEERNIDDASEEWINKQINRRRKDGVPVCVKVIFDTPDLKMGLSTPDCNNSGGGGRPPNSKESTVLDVWDKMHLGTAGFTGGNVVAFLKQIKSFT